MNDNTCRICGQDCFEAADRGAYLKRVNPTGETPAIWQCEPSCQGRHGNSENALMRALEDDHER